MTPDFTDFLAPGVTADDVPELGTLAAAAPLVGAFITLFRGTEAEVMLRLLVLREIGQESEAPRWTPEAAIPYERMWADDRIWLPHLLAGRRFHGRFLFDGDTMLGYDLRLAP